MKFIRKSSLLYWGVIFSLMVIFLPACNSSELPEEVSTIDETIEEASESSDSLIEENGSSEGDKIVNDTEELQVEEVDTEKLTDNIMEIDNKILEEIAYSYFLVFDFDKTIKEKDSVDYKEIFYYIAGAGTYPIKPFNYDILFEEYYDSESHNYIIPIKVIDDMVVENVISSSLFQDIKTDYDNYIVEPSDRFIRWNMRPEIYKYYDKNTETIEIPSSIVDNYLISKFNTTIRHDEIKEYNPENDTYTYFPFMGDFYYEINIGEVVVDGEIVEFSSTLISDIDSSLTDEYEVIFKLKFNDGEYSFLSVEISSNHIDISNKPSLYDYNLIYNKYIEAERELSISNISKLLQNKELTIDNIKFSEEDKVLTIIYDLDFADIDDSYTIHFNAELQDALLILSLYESIEFVKFNYEQDGYTLETYYNRDVINKEVGNYDLKMFSQSYEAFQKLDEIIKEINYAPEVMSTITYEFILSDK